MDKKYKIRLGETKSVNSINTDTNINLKLSKSDKQIINFNEQRFIDVSNLFDQERQNSNRYRIFGRIDYLSIMNNINADYYELDDFFRIKSSTEDLRNITDDFNIYLTKPVPPEGYKLSNDDLSGGFTEINNNNHIRSFEVVSKLDMTDYIKLGFNVNSFNEQQYGFVFNEIFDSTNNVDGLGFPLNEYYLYFQYKPKTNGNGDDEVIRYSDFDVNGNTTLANLDVSSLNLGDIIYGDIIEYNEAKFNQSISQNQEYKVDIPYENGIIRLKYNPFIPIKLQYFSNEINNVSINSTINEEIQSIPDYAKQINNSFIWKDFIDKGFIDPLTNEGVNYPFINNTHYVFNNIVLSVTPDLSNNNTLTVFNDIRYGQYQLDSVNPSTNLDDISKQC